jgi:microcystin-dependent protein
MTYSVNYSDNNKPPLTVFDNTNNNERSLVFPGRKVTGYGQAIAENFLALLENFASPVAPLNPTEGQLWYNNDTGVLQIWDDSNWKAANGIQKGPSAPGTADSKIGELWVDTANQQLRIFTGSKWVLVGPNETSINGLKYGVSVDNIIDSSNIVRYVLTCYIADVPIAIVSKDTFTPKVLISGFKIVKAGINIISPTNNADIEKFVGGLLPKMIGTASSADALNIPGETEPVASSKFLRSDTTNVLEFALSVRNRAGLTLGNNGSFKIFNTETSATVYNAEPGSSIDLQTNRNGIPATILRVIDNKIGINNSSPSEALDVNGNISLSGSIIVKNITNSTNLNNGSITTLGGMSVGKNLIVGDGITVSGTLQANNVQPASSDTFNLGTSDKRWNTVRAKTIIADTINGNLEGNIAGNANTASSLQTVTNFSLTGDVSAPPIPFDGTIGDNLKVFVTTLTPNIIVNKPEPIPNVSKKTDYVLTYRSSDNLSTGLLKQSRDAFVADLGIPIGAILPYAGSNPPYGFLFCDGSEIERVKFQALFDVISSIYNGSTALRGVNTFRLPDLRGRFPLGKDNMDNGGSVPVSEGGFVDAGGGLAGRVPDVNAQILGGNAGTNSVTLAISNLPNHTHLLNSGKQDYSTIAITSTTDPDASTGPAPSLAGQAQYFKKTGGIDHSTLGQGIGIMNPYVVINYIIRSGPPAF